MNKTFAQPRYKGYLTANKIYEFSSQKPEKDPKIRSFPTSVQPQELVYWEFRYPPPCRYYSVILDAKTFILFSSIPVCEGVILYQLSLKNIPTSVQQTREINYFGDMGENKKK